MMIWSAGSTFAGLLTRRVLPLALTKAQIVAVPKR